jgi:Gluconate 2-dehydrogenase subunit 3
MGDKPKKTEEAKDQTTLSRREWMLSLGSAIVLAGTAGTPGDAALAAGQAVPAVGAESTAPLPLGLYQPSFDHLRHVLMRDDSFVTIPAGAQTEYVRPRLGPFHPQFFSPEEFETIRRLVKIILGEDLKTSGPKSPPGGPTGIYDEVAEWIDLVAASAPDVRKLATEIPTEQRALAVAYFGGEEPVRELETFEPERTLREGLAWLSQASQQRFKKAFLHLTRGEQLLLASSISDSHTSLSQNNAGTRFFDLLKRECIRGFYTSRLGLGELDSAADTFHPEPPACTAKPNP